MYVIRDIVLAVSLYTCGSRIPAWTDSTIEFHSLWLKIVVKSTLWCLYWIFQSLVGAGIFCLGHDAGHSSLFESNMINNTIGFLCHSYLCLPYFSWRATHHAHHKATGSMERDENYVPYTRTKFSLPTEAKATAFDYAEVFEETPLYLIFRLFIMQAFGWWIYLSRNTMGCPSHPPGTSHFDPRSTLFKEGQRASVILSNVGIASMILILYCAGRDFVLWLYLPPFLLVNHWIVMFTYLHHSDPTIPHYRKGQWTFLRGAAATVDRPLLGWFGRFFFHNISHDHVAHHFFLRAPFYNGPQITSRIKKVLGEDYNYDSTPSFYALYRSFTQCLFVEEEGDIIFYKNKEGKAVREVDSEAYLKQSVRSLDESAT